MSGSVVPLEPWGETARRWFWPLFLIPGSTMGILDGVGVIDRSEGLWLILGIVLFTAWAVSGILWAVAVYRRRQASRRLPD